MMESFIGFAPKGYCDWSNKEICNFNDYICTKNNQQIMSFLSGDLPKNYPLPENFPFVGYITSEGEIYKCEKCEHDKVIREIILKNYLQEYLNTDKEFFYSIPYHMWQEEYFAMKKLRWIKISAFANNPTQPILFRYYTLTPEQTKIVYPK